MNVPQPNNWQAANYRYLMISVAAMRQELEIYIARLKNQPISSQAAEIQSALKAQAADLPAPSALEQLCTEFGLSNFERDILLLCVGVELDATLANLCGNAQGDMQLSYPTFGLVMSALVDGHWNAIAPDRPLRHWQLIEVGGGKNLTFSPLRINERVLHYLIGVDCLDEFFRGIIEPVLASGELVRSRSVSAGESRSVPLAVSHSSLAVQVAVVWSRNGEKSGQGINSNAPCPMPYAQLPIVQLCGNEVASKGAIASAACAKLGMKLAQISALAIPTVSSDLNHLILLWQREARLSRYALLLDCDELDKEDAAKENAIAQLIGKISSPLIITSRDRRKAPIRPLITFDVHQPTKEEQREIWQTALGEIAPNFYEQVEVLVEQFNLSGPTIYTVCAEVRSQCEEIVGTNFTGRLSQQQTIEINSPSSIPNPQSTIHNPSPLSSIPNPQSTIHNQLWDTCRAQSRPRLDDLAQRIEPAASWDDLVLPEAPRITLREIAAHVRQRSKVYEQWGFASKGGRGLGISALFAGTSGTGKTMSAEVLAKELRLDLYRIDLSSVVSKYIGETEKNLRRVFDAAEGGATILLFDEADAIFGKRSDVKDSHDRYANMEVSYLLQRMESYQGLAILTTNLKDSLDTAFLRRIRFVVKYTFPDAKDRAEIWRRIFPKNTPTEGLDCVKLARLNVAGGNIRNIALNAAFMAADAGEPVMMKHLLIATRTEYVKLERTLTDAEVKGWV